MDVCWLFTEQTEKICKTEHKYTLDNSTNKDRCHCEFISFIGELIVLKILQ